MEKLRIFVAEDDPLVTVGLELQLADLGYKVVGVANSGSEAARRIPTCRPDLVILDIKLPGMSGLEVSRLIMAESPLPIVLLTGYTEVELTQAADQVGAMAGLVKPFDVDDLDRAITGAWHRFQALQAS